MKTTKTPPKERKFITPTGSFRGRHCVAVSIDSDVLVRNSKTPSAGTVAFTRAEWSVFVEGVKKGEFDIK